MVSSSEYTAGTVYGYENPLFARAAGREVLGSAAVGSIISGTHEQTTEAVGTTGDFLETAAWQNFGHDVIERSGLVTITTESHTGYAQYEQPETAIRSEVYAPALGSHTNEKFQQADEVFHDSDQSLYTGYANPLAEAMPLPYPERTAELERQRFIQESRDDVTAAYGLAA